MVSCAEIFRQFWGIRGPLFTVAVVLGALPILFLIEDETMPESAKRCFYILVVMAFLWVTEALPVTVTALLPIVMFPLAEVLPARQISGYYVNDTTMLFFGGLVVAIAVEEWNLHKRIAILILKGVGSNPKWLMLGLMLPTWFLSMWISNTAAASMMIPIANAIIQQVKTAKGRTVGGHSTDNSFPMVIQDSNHKDGPEEHDEVSKEKRNQAMSPSESSYPPTPNGDLDPDNVKDVENSQKISIALTLCVAYSCNIGGIATLTGTPPNIVMRGIADDVYRRYQLASTPNDTSGSGISFANWMSMAFPLSLLTLILAWLILVIVFMTGRRCCTTDPVQSAAIKEVIDREWKGLGRMSLAEIQSMIIFVFLAVLWISRDPKESPGWDVWFKKGYVSDSVSSVLMAILLFILPAKLPSVCCFRKGIRSKDPYYTPILTWKRAQEKLPWGVLLLIGGGFALANGCKESGLSKWLGDQLATMDYLDTWVFNLVICLIVAAITEVTSNTATATLLMPIMADTAISLKINPLYLMTSSALATSFAFMLPVATPPNAIVFSYGEIKIFDMASVGIFMNMMAVATLTLCVNTWGKEIFDFDKFDPIFNTTLPVANT